MRPMQGLLDFIKRCASLLFLAGGWLLALIFGSMRWTPPGWAAWGWRRTVALGRVARVRPGRSAIILAMVVAFGYGAWAGWAWWQARPRPVEVGFEVTNPARTDVENSGKPNPLTVNFESGVAPLELTGKEVTQGISISPAIAGTWRWVSDSELEFSPTEEWPVGAEFKVSFARDAFAQQIRLGSWELVFQAPSFVSRIVSAEFYQDPMDPGLKKTVIGVSFSHPVDPALFEKRITLHLANSAKGVWGLGAETTRFVVSYDKWKTNAWIHSEPLRIPTQPSSIDVTIDRGVAAARGGKPGDEVLTQSIAIPGLYSLGVGHPELSVVSNGQNEQEQVMVLDSSAAVLETDMQKALSVWVLPVHHPASKPEERTLPYNWSDPSEITQAVLKGATRLELESLPAEREYTETHSFKYTADVGRYLYVEVDKGVKSFGGYILGARQQRIVQVPPFPAELRILSQGSLLTLSGENKVAVLVRDLPGVKIDIGRVLAGQLQHLVSQTSGNFSDPQFYGDLGPNNLVERFERKQPLRVQRGRAHYEPVDLSTYLKQDGENRRGLFLLSVQGYDPAADRTATEGANGEDVENTFASTGNPEAQTDKRLILVTDLGLIMKRELDGSFVIFVQSVASGEPVADATIEVIGKNGVAIGSKSSDAQGMARFPNLDHLSRERAPLMIVVQKAGDMSFLPLGRSDRMLDTSRFDVGGLANAREANQLGAYLFSDRGIYRPGDTFHVGMVIKTAAWTRPDATSLAGLPLEVEVLDPRGLTVKRERIKVENGGFNELTHTTMETSPTGTYTVNLYTVKDGLASQQIGGTQIKVQEFQPDRIKVTAHLSAEVAEGWVQPQDLKARVNVQNLFGTAAENRKVEAELRLSPAYPAFRSYPDYAFYDPQRSTEGYSEKLAAMTTDAKGEAEFALGLDKYARATYRVHLLARAFEPEGGRSVAAEAETLVSELPFLIGYKADGALNHVSRGSQRRVSVIAIDPKAAKTAVDDLKLQFIERKYVSVLTKQGSGLYKYESRRKEVVLKESPYAVPAAGDALVLPTDTPGDFAYVLRNRDGLELNRVEYGVAGQRNVTRSLERNAELQLTLNRKDYVPGGEIEISIRAPYVGAGLITVERDKVYAQKWFKTDTTASVQTIKLPENFEGNGYVSVQFVRNPASDEIFTSPLSYGYVPFATSLAQRTNELKLDAPQLVKPGQTLKVKLSAAQPARAVLFAVDEGILQVARYQNADPLGHFFQKRMLDVKTAQILDLILPEFSKIMAAAAPGGDAEGALGRYLNPFKRKRDKPAVYWSGIVDVNGEREFSYTVPETFNGTLRVMAVAINDRALGAAQTKSLVRGDFVLSPNAPAMVAPGDEFEVSVGIANNVADSGVDPEVAVNLKAASSFEVIGAATQKLKIGAMREGVAIYRLKAKDGASAQLGSAALTFSAALGQKSAKLTTDVSLRPATPYATQVSIGSFKGSIEVPVQRDLHGEHRRLEAAVSPLPLVAASGLSSYLASFPHLCTEQIVSRALPGLVLGKRAEFAPLAGATEQGKPFEEALRVLRTRQNADGGFGLWSASVQAHEFASVHAIQLLLEARERNENVPPDMLQLGLHYLQQLAASPASDLYAARTRAQAAYLLTRQGIVTTSVLTGLREMLDAQYPKQWQEDLAAVWLAASYKMLKRDVVAAQLIALPAEGLSKRGKPFAYENYYDPLIRDTVTLYVLARHFPERARSLPPEAMLAMMKPITDNRFNTLSAAWTILALDAYANTVGAQALGKISIAEVDAKGQTKQLALPPNLVPRVTFAPGTAKLRFGNDADLTSYYAVNESGFDRAPPLGALRNGIEIVREYVDAAGAPIKSVKLGEEVTVRVRLRAVDRDFVSDLAIVDLLPGGFEPVLRSQVEALPAANDGEGDYGGDGDGEYEGDGGDDGERMSGWFNPLGAGGDWAMEYADIREDRVVFYGSATRNMAEFSYRIKATNAGRFTVPPAYAESMYERTVQARSVGGTLTVEKAAQ